MSKTLFDKIWDSHIVFAQEGYPDAVLSVERVTQSEVQYPMRPSIRIGAVNYLNTKPLIHELPGSEHVRTLVEDCRYHAEPRRTRRS